MTNFLDSAAVRYAGAFVLLIFAALLEVFGDSLFQSGIYRSRHRTHNFFRSARWSYFMDSRSILHPGIFGRLPGVYVALFFLVSQVLAQSHSTNPHHAHLCGWDAHYHGRYHHCILARLERFTKGYTCCGRTLHRAGKAYLRG